MTATVTSARPDMTAPTSPIEVACGALRSWFTATAILSFGTLIRAFVFDFDGLILDTEEPIYRSWLEVYQAHGEELPFERWIQTVGSSNAAFDPRGHLEERLGRPLDAEVLEQRIKRRAELILAQAVLPGVVELVTAARAAGLKVGVASSSSRDWVTGHLERLATLHQFDCVRCRGDVAG